MVPVRPSLAELAARFEQGAVAQAAVDASGSLTAVNDAWCALFGGTPQELVGQPLLAGVPEQERAGNEGLLEDFLEGRRRHLSLERRLQTVDGQPVHVLLTASALDHEDGHSYAVWCQDAAELVRTRERLRHGEARWQALAEQATDLGIITDADGTLTYVSPAALALFGYDSVEVLLSSGYSFIHPDDVAAVADAMAEVVREPGQEGEVVFRVRRADGDYRWVEDRLRNLLHVPGVRGVVGNLRDVTDQRAAEEQLRAVALRDPSTGLPNRALLQDRLLRLHAEQGEGVLSLLALTLPRLEQVAAELGHVAVEELVAAVAVRLEPLLEEGDTLARLDPGVLVLARPASVEQHSGTALAEDVEQALAEPFEVAGRSLTPTFALGLAECSHTEAHEALRDALLAARWSSRHRQGRPVRYEPAMRLAATQRRDLAEELHADLESGRVCPWYQAVVDLETGVPVGFEALARWERRHGGVDEPAAFFGVAEEAGVLTRLSWHVLERACAEAGAWPADHGAVSVNVLPEQLLDRSFGERTRQLLERTGLPPARLVLELTEQGVLEDVRTASTVLSGLRELGVRVALDDFGTGWSSMLQLTSLPVDVLKVDRVFVEGMLRDRGMHVVVASTLELARRMGALAVAEGVETAEQAAALRELGCTRGQGYLFSRAVPLAELPGVLAAAAPPPPPSSAPPPLVDPRALRLAREMRGSGVSLHTVAAALNQQGFVPPEGRRWSSARVAEVLAAAGA